MPTNNQGAAESVPDLVSAIPLVISKNASANPPGFESNNLGNVTTLSDNSASVSTDERTPAPGILTGDPVSADNPTSASETLPTISEATMTYENKNSLPNTVFETG